jgi:hypothetical protein
MSKKTYTHDFDILFSICESPHENAADVTAEELLDALRRRAMAITVEEIEDASCHVQTIEDTL